MKTKILMAILVSLLVILVVSPGIPAGNKAAERGQGTGGKDGKGPPEIERGIFVNRPYSSPPWYPSDEETRNYRWYKRVRWADPSIEVLVNPTGISTNGSVQTDAYDAVVTAFGQWNGVGTTYSATVSRDDGVGPGFDYGSTVEVSWGTIDGEGGIIAVTYFSYYRNTKELIDCDIVFDSAEQWSMSGESGKFDVWNIAAHEAGHTLVLDDLISPKTSALTMHAYTWPGDTWKQTLGWGDILGIQKIYGE